MEGSVILIILLVAAYRPGPMQYIPAVTAVKKGAKAEYLIPEFEPILNHTIFHKH